MQNKIKIKYVFHNLCGCELYDSMTLRMCIQFVGCLGNPKKCLSMWVGGKIISNLNCKDDERWTKSKWFFQPSKPLRFLERNFGLESLSVNIFQVLVPKIMKRELNVKNFSTFKSFRTLKKRVCFKEFFYSKYFWKLSLFLSTLYNSLVWRLDVVYIEGEARLGQCG